MGIARQLPEDLYDEDGPKRVFLNYGEDFGEYKNYLEQISSCYVEITWSDEKIDAGDVEYIRADIVADMLENAAKQGR